MRIPRLFRRRPPQPITAPPSQGGPLPTTFDGLVNYVLALTRQAGILRAQVFVTVVFLTWLFLAFFRYPASEWRLAIISLSNPGFVPEITNPLGNFLLMLWRAFFSWGTLGHILAISLPFWFALQSAAIFLDDIFELKDVKIARQFLWRSAFVALVPNIIHVENGDVRPTDKRSPIYKIGGPGQVRVSLENVAVFEKVDGTPDLIGPTGGNMWYTRNLDGFESFRAAIDVRDQTVTIPDLYARTKDGIPVSVQNVRLLFSVQRQNAFSTLSRPYPYSESAILELVYNQSQGPWINSITGLVRSTLVRFIGESTLAEIFATVGEPEIARQIERQNNIREQVDRSAPTVETPAADLQGEPSAPGVTPPDPYAAVNRISTNRVPRPQISRRFYEGFTRGFPKLARQRGVRLEWIDIGTWHPAPTAGTVLAQHEEAFRVSAENMVRGDRMVLDELCRQEKAGELLRLIHEPVYRWFSLVKDGAPRNEIVAELVEEYLGTLRAARDDFSKENLSIPPSMRVSLEHIQRYQRELMEQNGGHYPT